jgi:DNA-binding NarL/FixJ family response regulator
VSKPRTRILLVDHRETIRAGVAMLIDSWPGMSVERQSGDADDAFQHAVAHQPDVILLMLDLRGTMNGLELLSRLADVTDEQTRVIVLITAGDTEAQLRAIELGASGLVFTESAPDELRRAIERVAAGHSWFQRPTHLAPSTRRPREQTTRGVEALRLDSLTERQREVAGLVCLGLKNKDIAERLCIRETTVRHHLSAIFVALDVANRFELVIFLYRHRFLDASMPFRTATAAVQ